jgi:aspartate racemase
MTFYAKPMSMKTVGIIGGLGPESTIEYYRGIIDSYREQEKDGNYPSIIINSINLKSMVEFVTANQLDRAADLLVAEVRKLSQAGADFAVLAANTPHIVFDEVQARSSLPLISIVESTCDAVRSLGLNRVGLFGTRFTMQARFYPDVFSKAGLSLVTPDEVEQAYIHEKYMGELLNNIFLPETREHLLSIVDRLKTRTGIEGLILGGTELPLILRDTEHNGIPFFDTTKIHVGRIVAELLS